MHYAIAQRLPWLLLLASVTAHAQSTMAEQCRRQYANDAAAQVQCARKAHTSPTLTEPPLISPLANLQLIFGFFDRRFPGFNAGKEHLGVDFAAVPGTLVVAVCDGTVSANNTVQADIVSAVVIIEHDCPLPLGTVYAYYGHVQSELLPGDTIAAGAAIGTVRDWGGNSHLHLGLSTRLHDEHWGVVPRGATMPALIAEGWLNPLAYLGAVAPRRAAGHKPRTPAPKVRGKMVPGKTKR